MNIEEVEQLVRSYTYSATDAPPLSITSATISSNTETTAVKKAEAGTRWSGAEWATEKKEIMLVGAGGIGSWTALALSRIEHQLYIVDGDMVDDTNVKGGQFYTSDKIGHNKANAVTDLCRRFGYTGSMMSIDSMFDKETGMLPICITGLDSMAARKLVFQEWKNRLGFNHNKKDCILIDGRLLLETIEIFTIMGNDEQAIREYEEKHLFDDSEVEELDCTSKQTTFSAMIIAGLITSTLCNWIVNNKIDDPDFRAVPFYQRMYLPILLYNTKNTENAKKEEA